MSYNDRNNYANNEDNNDGHHSNFSCNHGEEGVSVNPSILKLRERQKRNMIATLFLSQGTPMLLAGDELGHTQNGNNNAYCQDNEINWIDWQSVDDNARYLQSFTRYVISLRNKYPLLTSKIYIHQPNESESEEINRVHWYNTYGEEMSEDQWQEKNKHTLGWVLENSRLQGSTAIKKCVLLLLFNASDEQERFYLPKNLNIEHWNCLLDTYETDGIPKDIQALVDNTVVLKEKSMQVLSAIFA